MADPASTGGPEYPDFIDPPPAKFGASSDFVKGSVTPKGAANPVALFSFPFLGVRFSLGVNEKLMQRLVAAQKKIYDACCSQLNNKTPTEEQYRLWCWTGVLPLGDTPEALTPAQQAAAFKRIDFSTLRGGGLHKDGSAIDINLSAQPYMATRTGTSGFGGEMDVGLNNDAIKKVAGLTDDQLASYNKKKADKTPEELALTDTTDAAIAQFKKGPNFQTLLANNVWQPAVIGYDDAYSLFRGQTAPVQELGDGEAAKDIYERFALTSQALVRYFGLIAPGGNAPKDTFTTRFMTLYDGGKIHPEAVYRPNADSHDATRLKLYLSMASKGKAAALGAADQQIAAAKAAQAKVDAAEKQRASADVSRRKAAAAARKAAETKATAQHTKALAKNDPNADADFQAAMAKAAQDEQDALAKADTQKAQDDASTASERTAADAQADKANTALEQASGADAAAKQQLDADTKAVEAASTQKDTTTAALGSAQADLAAKQAAGASPDDIAAAQAKVDAAKAADDQAQADLDAKKADLAKVQDSLGVDADARTATLARLYEQCREDYGRVRKVFVLGQLKMNADESFSAQTARDPANGFLHLRREVVIALMEQPADLTWGVSFSRGKGGATANGDIMHFDIGKRG